MQEYVKQIINYIKYIKSTYGWQITVHDLCCFTTRYMSEFLPFRVHSNLYCIYMKNSTEIWDACIKRQLHILQKLKKPIQLGMCHCGVEEYILPIRSTNKNIGFISISGYRKEEKIALEKIGHIAEKYQLNVDTIRNHYFEGLSDQIPDMDLVYTLAGPLVTMLEYMYLKEKELYPDCFDSNLRDYSVFDNALQYIERFYREPITLEKLCSHCNCSKSYLSHMFKKKTGKNMNQYMNELRIAEAKVLLLETNRSITDIALSTGFSSVNYFTSTFHSVCNCSPREYRRNK